MGGRLTRIPQAREGTREQVTQRKLDSVLVVFVTKQRRNWARAGVPFFVVIDVVVSALVPDRQATHQVDSPASDIGSGIGDLLGHDHHRFSTTQSHPRSVYITPAAPVGRTSCPAEGRQQAQNPRPAEGRQQAQNPPRQTHGRQAERRTDKLAGADARHLTRPCATARGGVGCGNRSLGGLRTRR